MDRFEMKEARAASRLDFACEFKFASDEQAPGTIEGYASVYGIMDRGGDIVMPGAFKKTLAQWKKDKSLPPMLWQHDAGAPIGVWTDLIEDDKGLKVTGELILDIPDGAAAYARLKKGAVRGLSIGYRSMDDEIDRSTGARRLKQVELWEISLVTIPMLKEAQVFGVKGDYRNFNPRELEEALGDRGLSRKDRGIAVSVFREWLQRDAGESEAPLRDGARDALLALRQATEALRT